MHADIKSKMCRLGQFYLPSLFALLINVSISHIGLCIRKYQRCSLTFTLITQFICKISKEHIKGKRNSSASQTLSLISRSLVTYYQDDKSICSFFFSAKWKEILRFQKATFGFNFAFWRAYLVEKHIISWAFIGLTRESKITNLKHIIGKLSWRFISRIILYLFYLKCIVVK